MRPEAAQQGQPGAGGGRELPPDFAHRVATKIILTSERERDPDLAAQKVSRVILRNVSGPERLPYWVEMTEALLEEEEAQRYAAVAWASIVLEKDQNPRVKKFVEEMLDFYVDQFLHVQRPEYELEYRRKKFSYYSRILGDVFIKMMELNSELYEVISFLFSSIIRKEMALEAQAKEDRPGRRISMSRDRDREGTGKKLFDDVVDYVHARGEFKSDSLNQQNPNEFIAILADRMRGTRRYVIQDIMNRRALERKKEAEKELSERLASAEDIILARDTFKKAINLFWTEKRYNYKYLSVEKVRVTLQVVAVIVGIMFFLTSYLGIGGMLWWEGAAVLVAMYLFARVFCSRRAFRSFFPDDVSKELEVVVGAFTPAFRKMSKQQLDSFLYRQVHDPENLSLLPILPEFVKYVFAVMPERSSAIVATDELSDIMENMEIDIARTIRSSLPAREPI